jgi:diguanylate cyclase (GGDEF)-like protein
MNTEARFIEELYIAFQIIVVVILLNVSFPLIGDGNSIYLKILSLSYLGFMIFRIYKSIFRSTTTDNYVDNNILLTGLIEGFFLLVFVMLKIEDDLVLSNLVFAYVLVQTIRLPSKKRYYFCLVGFVIECYLFFMNEVISENFIELCCNGLLILFISFCISIVLKEFYKLQKNNKHYVNELEELNRKLTVLANTDYLTSLYNHKSFYLTINNFDQYDNGEHDSLCMALIDIDNFKRINDAYGHLAGDMILSNLANIMKKNVRKMDFVARYGGEEFVIIFPSTSLKNAETICERLRKKVEINTFEFESHLINITISIGLSRLAIFDHNQVHKFIKSVDELLYIAKNGGKNCIVSNNYD